MATSLNIFREEKKQTPLFAFRPDPVYTCIKEIAWVNEEIISSNQVDSGASYQETSFFINIFLLHNVYK